MGFQLYKARLKCLVRNKENMFWSYLFPIVLASCFFFAFNNMWTVESFETIKIAYIKDGAEPDGLRIALEQAKMSEDISMFAVTDTDREEAMKLLENNEIEAYVIGSANPVMFVKSNGLNETILKAFLDSYQRISITAQTIITKNPMAIEEGMMEDLMQQESFIQERANAKNPDPVLIYFYALLAFSCIFASNYGLEEVINIQADQSLRGARINGAPIRKMKLFLYNMLAGFTVHSVSILLLFLYLYYILKVKFGGNLLYVLMICTVGSITGMLLGAMVGVWVKQKASVKSAILTTITMLGSFLSGMMFAQMKSIIATKAPAIAYLNPVSLVSDAFYSLYYYDNYDRFYVNLVILIGMILLMGAVSYLGLRRKTYASI